MNGMNDVIVIGGGAAGLIAATAAAERHKTVILLEKSDRVGRKILASGNGRCNLMNYGEERYFGDSGFAHLVLEKCSANNIAAFFNRYGLLLKEESDGRVYPVTNQAASVVSVLKNAMKINGVNVCLKSHVISVDKKEKLFHVRTEDGKQYQSDSLIIACGGAAQPKLGGCRDGYDILSGLGHTLIPVSPSLVPVNTDLKSISGLSGIRIRCGVRLLQNGRLIHTEDGEVLFTDYGISGICIMQCARFLSANNSVIELDMLKHIFSDLSDIREELRRRRIIFGSCSPLWLLNGIVPEKIAYAVLKQAGFPLRGETAADADDTAIEKIISAASSYRIMVSGSRGIEYAQVTAGGMDCAEFDPCTLESRIIPGLFAAGEVLNVDGDCGGYNLMFAFASGYLAGLTVKPEGNDI